MIYVTGDTHGQWADRFSVANFPEQKEMTRDDFVIVCGDFGIWHDNNHERYWLKWLEEKPFTLCFVDGNHENFDRLYSDEFEIVDFYSGKAHKIRENIYHLMRGYIFDICNKKVFAFGGASSHDIRDGILDRNNYSSDANFKRAIKRWQKQGKIFRVNHLSWWKQEIPSQEEMDFGLKNLADNGNKVDFIITHCCPQTLASFFSRGLYESDNLTLYFNKIENSDFKRWFFGHYHFNNDFPPNFTALYEQIVRIE